MRGLMFHTNRGSRDRVENTVGVDDDLSDLMCREVPRVEWSAIKITTTEILGAWRVGAFQLEVSQLRLLLSSAVSRLGSLGDRVDECVLGRLCMSILVVLTGDAEERSVR